MKVNVHRVRSFSGPSDPFVTLSSMQKDNPNTRTIYSFFLFPCESLFFLPFHLRLFRRINASYRHSWTRTQGCISAISASLSPDTSFIHTLPLALHSATDRSCPAVKRSGEKKTASLRGEEKKCLTEQASERERERNNASRRMSE